MLPRTELALLGFYVSLFFYISPFLFILTSFTSNPGPNLTLRPNHRFLATLNPGMSLSLVLGAVY